MKRTHFLCSAALGFAMLSLPQASAAATQTGLPVASPMVQAMQIAIPGDTPAEFDRRGRRGKGGRRPRIPGGSGCDDPGDIIEHPECRG